MSIYSSQKRFFEEAYKSGEHGWPVTEPTPFVRSCLKIFRKECRAGRILDLGCGEGRHTLFFAKEGYRAIGLDMQPLALKRAKAFANSKGIAGGFHFMVGDVLALPFKNESFDLLIDYGCLHHILKKDFSLYLRNTLSQIKRGGYFLLSCFSTKFRHENEGNRKRDWLIHKDHYDRFFKKSDFKKLFGKNYHILEVEEEKSHENPLQVFYHVLMQKI